MSLYRLTAQASKDLRDIRDWIANARPDRAQSFVSELSTTFRLLGPSPLMGRERAELRKGLRSFIHGSYTIFYRPAANGIEVMRVVHGRRDHPRIFEP